MMMQNQEQWQEYIKLVKPISPFAEPTTIPDSAESGIFPVRDEVDRTGHASEVDQANGTLSVSGEQMDKTVASECQGDSVQMERLPEETRNDIRQEDLRTELQPEDFRDKGEDDSVFKQNGYKILRSENHAETMIDQSFPQKVLHETRFEPRFIPEEENENWLEQNFDDKPRDKVINESRPEQKSVRDAKNEKKSDQIIDDRPHEPVRDATRPAKSWFEEKWPQEERPEPQFVPKEKVEFPQDETDVRDELARTKLDLEIVRRRSQEELVRAQKFSIERFAEALLPVKDSLEAALKIDVPTLQSIKEGVEMTLKQLNCAFEKNKLTEINPMLGEKLDPMKHQAISVVPVDEKPNTIIQVMQKGYMLADRLLRPALVTVGQQKNSEDEG